MGAKFQEIPEHISTFIKEQKIFFVGTAGPKGRVNVSPKGMDSFRVINENRVVWLNLTGSGNETAAHVLQNPRMTIMFCSFDKKPLILRLYGEAKVYHERDEEFQSYLKLFPETPGSRQIIELKVDLVQTSCGYGVPFMDYVDERPTLRQWGENKSEEKIRTYWTDKNSESIDGFETKING